MGFALFDQSGTFNPLDYGLSPGDMLWVTCVGGGGGGSASSSAGTGNGGTGGTSSFGAYLSAAGGYTGATGAGTNKNNGTGGGGGWLPGWDFFTGTALPSLPYELGYQQASYKAPKTLAGWGATTLVGIVNYEAQSSATIAIRTYAASTIFEAGALTRPLVVQRYATAAISNGSATTYTGCVYQNGEAAYPSAGYCPPGYDWTNYYSGNSQQTQNIPIKAPGSADFVE